MLDSAFDLMVDIKECLLAHRPEATFPITDSSFNYAASFLVYNVEIPLEIFIRRIRIRCYQPRFQRISRISYHIQPLWLLINNYTDMLKTLTQEITFSKFTVP